MMLSSAGELFEHDCPQHAQASRQQVLHAARAQEAAGHRSRATLLVRRHHHHARPATAHQLDSHSFRSASGSDVRQRILTVVFLYMCNVCGLLISLTALDVFSFFCVKRHFSGYQGNENYLTIFVVFCKYLLYGHFLHF